MKKSISIISICAALSVLASISFSASAEGASKGDEYIGSIQLNRYALSAEEATSGNAYVDVSAYIRGAIKDGLVINNAQIALDSDSQIYMRNLIDPGLTYTECNYSCLGTDFTTAYKPFCFGKLRDNVYNTNTFLCTTREYCADPVNGNNIYYRGNDTISFKLPGRFYIDENGERPNDNKSHEIICSLTLQPDGSATYSFPYASIYKDYFEIETATGVIPYYQPELLNEGDRIPDFNNRFGWMADQNADTSFLGNSNDFPLIQTQAFLKKNTPCGIYEVGFDETSFNILSNLNGSSYKLPMKYQSAAIAVGVESADISIDSTVPTYACYYAEDTKTITGASVGFDYICDVSYSDGTSESAKNVTGAVNAGTSPHALLNNANYFIDDVPMYCGDTPLTYNGQENKVKILIGKKGDVNLDGNVDIADATAVLAYYAQRAAGLTPELVNGNELESTLAFFLGDTDTESQSMDNGGSLSISDATNILSYYANNAAGNAISWDKFLK